MTEEEYYEEHLRKAHLKQLSEESKLQALREIKDDLKEIKDGMMVLNYFGEEIKLEIQ